MIHWVYIALVSVLLAAPPELYAHAPDGDPAPSLQVIAKKTLADRFPADAHRLQIRVLRASDPFDAQVPHRIDFPFMDRLPRGRTQVNVYTKQSSGWQKSGWALLYVALYDSVMVTRHVLDADTPIDTEAVHAAWMETTRFRGEPLRAAEYRSQRAEHPLYSTHRLQDGRALRLNDVRPPYAAQTGSSVEMRYQRRGLVMRLRCKAREPGYTGEVIRLYAPDTDTVYRARLTGPGTAKWIETL